MKSRAGSLIAITSVVLTLFACGDGEPSADERQSSATSETAPATTDSSETSAPAADELQVAVRSYSDGFLGGDPVAAYEYFSGRCKEKISLSYFTGIVTAAKATYGSALPMSSYDAQVDGDLARVSYTYDVPALNQEAELWVREDGLWKTDDC